MKQAAEFVKTTLIGGVVVILPVALLVVATAKALVAARKAVEPLAAGAPGGPIVATVVAAAAILAICFTTGVIARTRFGERGFGAFEEHVLERIPGYDLLRVLSRRALGKEEGTGFAPALVTFPGYKMFGFVVEEHANGDCTVFVPAVPTPGIGSLYLLPRDKVELVDVPFTHAVECLTAWGSGSRELVAKTRRA